MTGLDGLPEALDRFLAVSPELTVNPPRRCFGDTASAIGNCT
jgi:hypothetical protein